MTHSPNTLKKSVKEWNDDKCQHFSAVIPCDENPTKQTIEIPNKKGLTETKCQSQSLL